MKIPEGFQPLIEKVIANDKSLNAIAMAAAVMGNKAALDCVAKIAEASRDKEEIIYAEFDLDENQKQREYWGLLKDRRPDMYKDIC